MTDKEFDAIGNIMDNFNFDNVHEVMTFLNWKWVGTEFGIPTKSELRTEARRLLTQSVKEKTNVATGGFEVHYLDEEGGWVGLKFVISEWDSEIGK